MQVSPYDDLQGEAAPPEGGGDNSGCGQRPAQDEHPGEQEEGQSSVLPMNLYLTFNPLNSCGKFTARFGE